jgi:hypothetical protein
LNGITRRIPRARLLLSKMSATAARGEYGKNRPVFHGFWQIAAIRAVRTKETYL